MIGKWKYIIAASVVALAGCANHPRSADHQSADVVITTGKPLLGIVPDLNSQDSQVGVLVSGTTPDTPAAKSGVQAGDLLTGFNDQAIHNLPDLTAALANAHPGQKVRITVLRATKTVHLNVTLAARPTPTTS